MANNKRRGGEPPQERKKSIEDIQSQAMNLMSRTDNMSRRTLINQIASRYINNITSAQEYRNASNNVQRAYMNGDARELSRWNEELERLNQKRVARSSYMI